MHSLTITGTGNINGRAKEFMTGFDQEGEIWNFGPFRPKIFVLTASTGIEIRGIGFSEAPFWGLHMLGCEHVLVDGLRAKSLHFPQTPLVKGDARSYSIAAASVLAKVTRDRLMLEYDRQWPVYGFAEHKGYGTPQHLAALAKHGPCPIHRRSFAPLKQKEADLF